MVRTFLKKGVYSVIRKRKETVIFLLLFLFSFILFQIAQKNE